MKTKLTMLLAVILLVCAGCSWYREYQVGAVVSYQERNFVRVRAQLWYVVNSGMFDHIDWTVNWGDGAESVTEDGSPVGAGNFSPSNPLTLLEWAHAYTAPGEYTIEISCGGSSPAVLEVTIVDMF